MKTKFNLLLIPLLIMGAFFLTFTACEDDEEDDQGITGKWYVYNDVDINVDDQGEEAYDDYYYKEYDYDFYAADIYDITESTVTNYYNNSGTDYSMDEMDYELSDGKIIVSIMDGSQTYYDTAEYHFDGEMLVIVTSQSEGGEEYYRNEMYLKPYSGDLPPASWTTEIQADSYESDDEYTAATEITIGGQPQQHSTTSADDDWFHFDAVAGETYVLKVSGYMDNYLRLYSTDGTTLIDSDDDSSVENDGTTYWGNPYLVWTCQADGTYYFKVTGFGGSSIGYYYMEVNLDDGTAKKSTDDKEKKKPENHSFFFSK
ncbi:hypothetical protein L21SP5_01588 [Salinivirga cyanobacteriivorans]|uniref:Peptidase C-terminal archaeal/bacterial domain-containing protein n=1 Tax=Salinivirga cyanobacteriivorans TaxID=1307839 RepID=A0A0S2HZ30_9BACT|nr:hypothetical protein [Salinivirga cyanobacteriivorans]ALO15234.1 hypothetical protein L21SP5_01588 [Salinivirga cyanobacteriivorans]